MSEREVFEALDDGEPPSSSQVHPESYLLAAEQDDSLLHEYREQHLDIWDLCAAADTAIDLWSAEPDYLAQAEMLDFGGIIPDDTVATRGDVRLRRKRHVHVERSGQPVEVATYFLVDRATGYCRSWTNQEVNVHWCHEEGRYEPASSVKQRLLEYFPDPRTVDVPLQRKIGFIASMFARRKT